MDAHELIFIFLLGIWTGIMIIGGIYEFSRAEKRKHSEPAEHHRTS